MTSQTPIAALVAAWQVDLEAVGGQISGIGIDLVELDSFGQLLAAGGQSFMDAAWTEREQQDTNKQPEALAGKWAAKEAVMKALQHGIGDLDPRDVEIVTTTLGAPRVVLHRTARVIAKRRQICSWHVTVTHEGGWAAAMAVASSLPRVKFVDLTPSTNQRRNLG